MSTEITNSEELDVLRRYAAGEDMKAISKALGFPVKDGAPDEVVVGIVSNLAGFQRSQAREMVRRAEAKMAQRAAQATQPASVRAPVRAADLELKPRTEDPMSSLLAKAEQSGNARLVKQAEKVRQAAAALEEMVTGYAKRAEAERAVTEARRKLAEAEALLRQVSGGAGPTKAAQRGAKSTSARNIRAWARAAGMECNPLGIIPARVMDAYLAAHPKVA